MQASRHPRLLMPQDLLLSVPSTRNCSLSSLTGSKTKKFFGVATCSQSETLTDVCQDGSKGCCHGQAKEFIQESNTYEFHGTAGRSKKKAIANGSDSGGMDTGWLDSSDVYFVTVVASSCWKAGNRNQHHRSTMLIIITGRRFLH